MACDGTIGLSSEFHGFNGSDRYVLTIITDAECPPETIGFRLLNEGEEPLMPQAHAIDIDVAAPVAPEDEDAIVGVEIDGEHDIAGGMEIHGQPVIAPDRDDHLSVTGVEIYRNTALATMREACQFYHVSTSGGKTRRAFAETSFFFLVGARCLSAGRTRDSRVDQQGFEPPPAVCQRSQDQRHTN